MKLTIVVPFEGAEEKTQYWSGMEKKVDFANNLHDAARCTVSFAATELSTYISKTIADISIDFSSSCPSDGMVIELVLEDITSKSSIYKIAPIESTGQCGVVITGQGRAGVLYGAYEFLKQQGWRWYAPGGAGEIAPETTQTLILTTKITEYSPDMADGRGFDFEGGLKDSEELWLWMARNRLNVAAYRHLTVALQRKLCLEFKNGGHIFEEMLHPDKVLENGKTIWEEHPDWYGKPPVSEPPLLKEDAFKIQFCTSNQSLLNYLGNQIVDKLSDEWKYVDRLDIWTFDTFGRCCSCEECERLGNGSDQALYLLSELRKQINQALIEGKLQQDVRLIVCAYDGTSTISAPQNKVPSNLIDAKDMVVYYPIMRCYAHDYNTAEACPENLYFNEHLTNWFKNSPSLPMIIGEYYNVSKFEDLPLLFTKRMAADIPYYHKIGVTAITYMHLPMINWAMRSINQVLYAELAWNVKADVKSIVLEYLDRWYSNYAEEMGVAYELLEEGFKYCANLRAWAGKSILSQLLIWDGAIPEQPLMLDEHFEDVTDLIKKCRVGENQVKQALEIILKARKSLRKEQVYESQPAKAGLNPTEHAKLHLDEGVSFHLDEDARQCLYGYETLKLMTDMIAYHDALYRSDSSALKLWEEIEETAEHLSSYYMPITYGNQKVMLECRDALTRTQLKNTINRCRGYRNCLQ